MAEKILKQIQIGDTLYELDVKYHQGYTVDEIINLSVERAKASRFIVATDAASTPAGIVWNNGTTNITGTLAADKAVVGGIYLVKHAHIEGPIEKDIYDEYVSTLNDKTAIWEKIGNTDIDLSQYCKKGTATSPAVGNTAPGGADTIDTQPNADQTAVGTVSVTYDKATGVKGAVGSNTNTNTGGAGGHSHTFTGATATISISSSGSAASNGGHNHTVTPSTAEVVNSVTGNSTNVMSAPAATDSKGDHTHSVTINTHEHAANVTAVTGVGGDGTVTAVTGVSANGTASVITGLGGSTTTVLTGVKASSTATVLTGVKASSTSTVHNASVSGTILVLTGVTAVTGVGANGTTTAVTGVGANGTVAAYTSFTPTTATVLTGVRASSTATVLTSVKATGTASVAGAVSNKTMTITSSSTGAHTHKISATTVSVLNGVTTGKEEVLSGITLAAVDGHTHSVSVSGSTTYRPTGSLNAVEDHKHIYTSPASHTHDVITTPATATGSASVPVAGHVHVVNLPNHSHGLGSHTHIQQ